MLELRLLGTLDLRRTGDGELGDVLRQPKRAALLSYLGATGPGRFQRRDTLLALFWPELDTPHARDALSTALRYLRRGLGAGVLVARGDEEIGLASDAAAGVWCDVAAFDDEIKAGRLAGALALYCGDFLEGFHLSDAPAFDEWLERERGRLRKAAADAARQLSNERRRDGVLTDAIRWGHRALELQPDDERTVRRIIELFDEAGDRAGALRVYEAFARRLREEYGSAPSRETLALVDSLRAPTAVAKPAVVRDEPQTVEEVTHAEGHPALGALTKRYRVVRWLGSGGMADIFLARDVRHDRQVALKVLRAEVSAAIGVERFLREIELTAQLQHPHILTLYDSGHAGDLLYYVMPYVEGESLRHRLRRERQLPVEEAVQIAREVASALDYAHRRGVVHRDIKPENILLQDGQALVADFGIALAVSAASGDRPPDPGLSFGSPPYMSPEQASRTSPIDARSDIYSLAAVLYEMLSGEPPQAPAGARTPESDVVGHPRREIRELRESVPVHVEAALRKALARLPADRYSSAAAFSRALTDLPMERVGSAEWSRRRVASIVAASFAGLAALGAGAWSLRQANVGEASAGAATQTWDVVLPDSAPLSFASTTPLGLRHRALAISPDGTLLVYVARQGRADQLHLRKLGQLGSTPLEGTADAYGPFFSPDGKWIGFFVGAELKKVLVDGGHPVTLAVVPEPVAAAWAPTGRILVAANQGNVLAWVPSEGGQAQPIANPLAMRIVVGDLDLLPGDEAILHGALDGSLYLSSLVDGRSYAITADGVVRRDSVHYTKLLYGRNPRLLGSDHLVYFAGDNALMALPFDVRRRKVLGPAVPILSGVRIEGTEGGVQIASSPSGTVVYAPGENLGRTVFVWVDHASGRVDTLPVPPAAYGAFDLSPDGRRILARVRPVSGPDELWVFDVDRGAGTQLALTGIPSPMPRWWPRGDTVVVVEIARTGAMRGLAVRQALGPAGKRDTLDRAAVVVEPSPNGTLGVRLSSTGFFLMSATAPHSRRLVPGNVHFPAFSPDGRWLAYTELMETESEVYVTPVDHPTQRYRISTSGGEEPVWTHDGKRIVFRRHRQWLSVDILSTAPFRTARPRVLLEGRYLQVPGWSHDISADGRRQLVLVGPPGETTNRLVVITNWLAEVERLAPRR